MRHLSTPLSTRFSTRSAVSAVLALIALGNAPAMAADTAAASDPAPAAPVVPAADSTAQLKAALPDTPALTERDGALWWQVGDAPAVKVVAQRDGNAVVETVAGQIAVQRKLLADGRREPLAALPALIARAKSDGIALDQLMLAEGIMTGLHLRSADVIVLPEGAMKKATPPADDRAAQVARVKEAVQAVEAELAKDGLEALSVKATLDVLNRVALRDDERKFDLDEVLPSFARRIIRHGWLEQLGKDAEVAGAAKKLQAAVAEAEGYKPTTLFEGKGLRLAEVKDAFGHGGWVLDTPSRTAYTRAHPSPEYLFGTGAQNLNVVVQLPAGADPLSDGRKATGATLFFGSQRIAWWDAKDGFGCDKDAWRKALPEHPARSEGSLVRDFLPPHVVVVELDGDIARVITAHGQVDAPADGAKADADAFLEQAAKALPDAAHLDLLGEYLFYYVYDSPDSKSPLVIGNKQVKGDIHQTAAETVGTACGGQCRGDCDDLSELYEVVADKQGRNAQVITLPAHAACAFAEKDQEQQWHVFVLQTGQPLEFVDKDLPGALSKTYLSFDDSETFDPNGLGLLLRFSGENTRSAWRLSWRIFAEPAYAKTMIDVQRDWHFQTYQVGIKTMLGLIAGGDDDTANYRELSGLYSFTGQYAKAAEYHRKALERTPDAQSKLFSSVELVQHLFDGNQTEEARKVAEDLIDNQLPALRAQIGPRSLQLGLELAAQLNHGRAYDLALKALDKTCLDEMAKQIDGIAHWLKGSFNQRQWESAEQLRRLQQEFVATGVELLRGMGTDTLPENEPQRRLVGAIQQWLTDVAFHDVDEDEDALTRYALAGQFYAAILGERELLAMLDNVALPKDAKKDHTARVSGLAQMRLDLPWIKLSVPFWSMVLERKFDRHEDTLDRAQALAAGKHLAEAFAAGTALELESPQLEHFAHIGAVITALVGQDEPALRKLLARVKQQNDKRLRDDTAQWLGDAARFCDLAWYKRVVASWEEVVDYKPKWYWIAWRAALNNAPAQALMVADRAAQKYADDQSMVDEARFMHELLTQQGGEPKPTTPAEVPKQPVPHQ